MTNEELQKNIKRNKDGIWVWTGSEISIKSTILSLWKKWEEQGLVAESQGVIWGMHENVMCVDRRYLTTSPETWESPNKKACSKQNIYQPYFDFVQENT